MRACVVEAPFDLSMPRWEDDPTFDLDYHLRSAAVPGDAIHDDASLVHREKLPPSDRCQAIESRSGNTA